MADKLCTRDQAKSRIRIPPSDTVDDALIDELIEEVTDWIQGFTRRRLLPDPGASYTFDVSAGSEVEVPRGIRAITALEVATTDQPDTGGTYASATASNLVLLRPTAQDRRPGWPADRVLIRGTSAVWPRPVLNGARILGDYDFAATPPAVVVITADAVAAAYGARGKPASATIGAGGRAVFPWATFFAEGSPAYETLARYRVGGRGIA